MLFLVASGSNPPPELPPRSASKFLPSDLPKKLNRALHPILLTETLRYVRFPVIQSVPFEVKPAELLRGQRTGTDGRHSQEERLKLYNIRCAMCPLFGSKARRFRPLWRSVLIRSPLPANMYPCGKHARADSVRET